MTVTARSPVRTAITLIVLFAAGFLLFHGADAAWIRGISSNFDLHNFTEGPVNDLELTLGGITVDDILRLYSGEASRGWIPHVEEGNGEVIILWKAPDGSYLKPCEWLHLGLSLRSGAPEIKYAKATWTLDGEPVGTIAFVWQNWAPDTQGVVDVIIPPSEFPVIPRTGDPDTLIVERRWAPSEVVIPLDNLTQKDPLVAELEWSPEPLVDKFTPDSRPSGMMIPWDAEGSVLVQYSVTLDSTDEVEAVFTNQARIVLDPAPRPGIIKPVDNLGERPDLVYGTVNLWATETTGLWDDQVIVARFEYSTDGGQRWVSIGEDDDGTVPTYSDNGETYQHNWWHVPWDTSKYEEGSYLVRTIMFDQDMNFGEDRFEVYIDPTPPIPILDRLPEHEVFLEPGEISCHTLDEDIVSVIWEVQLKLLNYVKGIPHLDQHDYGVGQTANGNNYCAPTGAAACLKWWAAHGYPKLTQNLSGNPLTNTQLVEGLATDMGTVSTSGTSGAGIVNGLRQWINDRSLLMTVKEHATINPTTIRNEIENCKEDVILGVLWNTGGGHIVTVDSIANFTNADGTTNIGVMDPWVSNIVNVAMEADGDIHWPGKAGVQASGLLVTVSPVYLQIVRVPWSLIGQEAVITWDPRKFEPSLYFLRATMTDSKGNQASSQIVARVMQPFLPVMLTSIGITAEGNVSLAWEETEHNMKYAYTVEYCDDLAEGIWREAELQGLWPIPDMSWTGDSIAELGQRYYRVMKDYEPK